MTDEKKTSAELAQAVVAAVGIFKEPLQRTIDVAAKEAVTGSNFKSEVEPALKAPTAPSTAAQAAGSEVVARKP